MKIWILNTIIVLHGLIHLLGFLKAFDLARIEELKLPISKAAGLFWLLTCLLFLGSTTAFFLNVDWWWMMAAGAAIVSQVLVIISWRDAKYGTIANVIILAWCIFGN